MLEAVELANTKVKNLIRQRMKRNAEPSEPLDMYVHLIPGGKVIPQE
jgi:hypothetical protein